MDHRNPRREASPGRRQPAKPREARSKPSARPYDRRRELARVLPVWPHEIEDETPTGRARIIAKLQSALRAERRRGIAGHWTYDLGRHMELLRLYRLELAALGVPSIGAHSTRGGSPGRA